MTMQFPIDFDRDFFVGRNVDCARLEIFDVGEFGVNAEEHAAEIAHQRDVVHLLKNAHVEHAVLEIGLGENLERAAVEATVADEDEGAFDRVMIPCHAQLRRFLGDDLRGGEEIAERAEHFFRFQRRAFDHLRIESDSGHLHEAVIVRAGEIDRPDFSGADNGHRLGEVERDAELHREDIDRADGDQSEIDRRAIEAIDHFIDRAVATGGDDRLVTLLHGAFGLSFRIARTFGEFENEIAGESVKFGSGLTGAFAARGRIENDAGFIHVSLRREDDDRLAPFSGYLPPLGLKMTGCVCSGEASSS